MRQAPLEERSLTELRAMAQAMDANFAFNDDKQQLIKIIKDCMEAKVPKPRIPDDLKPVDDRFYLRPPKHICTQTEVAEYLKDYTTKGLQLSFPTSDTWFMRFGKREDTGTLRMPPIDVLRCAKEIMR